MFVSKELTVRIAIFAGVLDFSTAFSGVILEVNANIALFYNDLLSIESFA